MASAYGAPPPYPDDPYADARDGEPPPSKAQRGVRLGCAVLLTAFLAFAAWSSKWSHATVLAPPNEIYQMYSALTAIVPGPSSAASLSQEIEQKLNSKTPVPVFQLHAGIWSAYVEGLCTPSTDALRNFVDEHKCKAKLSHFCEDMLQEHGADPTAKKLHDKCQTRVSQGGIAMSLLADPPKQETFPEVGDLNVDENVEYEFEVHGDDADSEFCETVADCELLAQMQPWTTALACLVCIVLALMALSTVFFASAVLSEDPKHTTRGCHVMFATTVVLAGVVAIDVHNGEAFPIEKLFRIEDLFYFMLPDASDEPPDIETAESGASASLAELHGVPLHLDLHPAAGAGRLQRRWGATLDVESAALVEVGSSQVQNQSHRMQAISHTTGGTGLMHIPATKWQGMLMVLTGNLISALVSNDLTKFFVPLKEAVLRGFSKSSLIFDAWFKYLKKAINSPDAGAKLLNVLVTSLVDMTAANEVCGAAGTQACESLNLNKLQEDATKLFEDLRRPIEELIINARRLMQMCLSAISDVKRLWSKLKGPVERLVQHVVEAIKKAGGGLEALLSVAQPEILADLKALFTIVFSDLPQVVVSVRDLASKFVNVLREAVPVVKQIQDTARQAQDLIFQGMSKAAIIMENGAGHMEHVSEGVHEQIRDKMQEKMDEVSAVWLDGADAFVGDSSALLELGNGRSQAGRGLLGMLAGFATGGGMSSPAARIGAVIISEIEHMGHPKRGFQMNNSDPFRHFGWITIALTGVTAAMFLSYALFVLGFIKA